MRRALALLLVVGALPVAAAEFRLDRVRESLTGIHRHYTQFIDGIEVVGGERIERERAGTVETIYESRSPRLAHASSRVARSGQLVYVVIDGEARLARKAINRARAMEPYAEYYDAETGALLRRDPLFWNAQGRVFEANPVAKLNDPSLRDQNNDATAVPDQAYSIVELPNLAPSGPLSGPNARIVDTENPNTVPAEASQSLLFDRSRPEFEEVNAYFHIDTTQRYLQSLGYVGSRRLVDYVMPIDAHAANGTDNSYYVSGFIAGQGQLYFGDGGTDDAEDPDIMIHEFGHAIQDWIAPGTFTGASASQPRALGEGFGDYWAFSAKFPQAVLTGRDAFCIADWDARCAGDDPSQNCSYPAGANCLRRVDSTKTMRDYLSSDTPGTEHRNGEIWSSALHDLFLADVTRYGVDGGKRITDTLIIEGTFDVPPNPTYATMARRILAADRILYNGANQNAICSAMTLREILPVGSCSDVPRGELTLFQSAQQGIAIPDLNSAGMTTTLTIDDARTIDTLYVDVDIAHTARGDLQLTLTAPDGRTVILQNASLDRTPNVRATFGLDAQPAQPLDIFRGMSANGTWKLTVADVRPRDQGSLVSWSLVIRFAGDAPLLTRPGSSSQPIRQTIPAAAHTPGANGTTFVTDLRLANRSNTLTAHVTAIFTPSLADGTTTFSAVNLTIAPDAALQLDDVVARTFRTTGTGQIELQSDHDIVIATSRTYTTSHGTLGQFVPTVARGRDTTAAAEPSLILPQLEVSDAFRTNLGVAELAGAGGMARFTIFDPAGQIVRTIDVPIAPFSHVQLPLDGVHGELRGDLRVLSGACRITGYASVVDNRSGDATYVPSLALPPAGKWYLPAIHSAGVNGTAWRTDLSIVNSGTREAIVTIEGKPNGATFAFAISPGAARLFRDVVADALRASGLLSVTVNSSERLIVTSRTWTEGSNGSYGQFVDAQYGGGEIPPISAERTAVATGIDDTDAFRTNIGIVSDHGTGTVTVTVHDAEGNLRGQTTVTVGSQRVVQFPLRALISGPLSNGRVSFEGASDIGTVYEYVSVIDNSSSDPLYISAR